MINRTDPGVVLVTGATGLLGHAVAERLEGRFTVVRSGRRVPAGQDPHRWVAMDTGSDGSVEHGLADLRTRFGEQLTSVVHLAAYYDFSGAPSPLYEQVTVRGTERLLRGLRSFQAGQFIFSSTMLVHVPSRFGHPVTEDTPLDGTWDYPRSKIETEKVIHDERDSIPCVILRIAGVYDEWCHSIPISQEIRRIYERDVTSHLFPGDMHHGQSFVHLEDTVDSIVAAIGHRETLTADTTFLIGEPNVLSYGELQDRIGHLVHGEEWTTFEIPKTLAKLGAWVEDALPLGPEPFIKPWMIDIADQPYCLDISRAREQLGWEPKHGLRGTLPVMIQNLLGDPVRWYRENDLDIRTIPRNAPHDVAAPAA
jgi:nucleoside-diphosphate-sugar epimerase